MSNKKSLFSAHSHNMISECIHGFCPRRCRQFGEAQLRYGRYFQQIVTPGMLPALRKSRLTLSKVTLHGMLQSVSHTLKHGSRGSEAEWSSKQWSHWESPGGQHTRHASPIIDPPRQFLAIYQRGRLTWADEAPTHVRNCLICTSFICMLGATYIMMTTGIATPDFWQ